MRANLVWIDLEMTGLNPDKGVILEIATIVTDDELEILAEGPNIAINYPEEILRNMDEWSRSHHQASGLLDRIKGSLYDCQRAEQETLNFISSFCKEGECLLCGNSIWQDRHFLRKHMPRLETFFHYRNIDVSSIKELVKRWYPDLPPYEKEKAHLALSDIKESINELKYYRQKVFLQKLTLD
ncbi:MAG: oligoribonuclease [Pseudomonadota bacterium]